MHPLRLSDDELSTVMAATQPLSIDMRRTISAGCRVRFTGTRDRPGLIARTCAELQRQFFDPTRRFGQVRVTRKHRRPESCAKFFAPLLAGRAPGG
jgi:hypothetical protein